MHALSETVADDESLATATDPVSRLPPELATACFRFLAFRWRFAVSQVSRAWRRVALADACLWNTLRTGATQPRVVELLETLLARSGDVPFNFAWVSSAGMRGDVLEVLIRTMGRMRTLQCWGASPRLLGHAAPALRVLVLHDLLVELPAGWTHSVPRLEVLELDEFSITADCEPLPALTSFRGRLAEGSSDPVLARVFPLLVTLNLEGVTQETVRTLGPPPRTCQSVFLRARWGTAVDYAPFERACHQLCIPHIVLSGATSISAATEEFARATQGECTMFVRNESSFTLECSADGVLRVVEGARALPFVAEAGGFAHLARLAALTLPLALLLGISARQVAFPSLRMLRLELAPADVRRAARPPVPLAMPRLAEVVLEAYQLDYARDESAYSRSYNARSRAPLAWLLADCPGVLRALVGAARGLETLTVVMSCMEDAEHFAARQDLGALRALAETLNVTHRSAFFCSEDSDGYVEDYYEDDDGFDDY